MGGRSGGRPATRPQLDGGLRLDLYRLKRQGWLVPGGSTSGTMTWTDRWDGKHLATMEVTTKCGAEGGEIRLRYTTVRWDGSRVASDYAIAIVSTPQPFGGRRWWFVCPATGSRAAVLHMPAGRTRFASQAALRGSYRTQRVSPRDRALEKARDIRMAMGGSANLAEPFPDKPPRMHRSTYQRQRERAELARSESLGHLAAWLDRTVPAWRRSGRSGEAGQG